MSKTRVLFLTKTPFTPPRDGGAIRAESTIRVLEESDCSVTSVVVRGEKKKAKGKIHWSQRLIVLLSALRTGSISVMKWFSFRVVDELVEAISENSPDIVIIAHSQLVPYGSFIRCPKIIDLHNVESELLEHYARSRRGLLKAVIRWEASRVRSIERRITGYASGITVVSEHDAELMNNLCGYRPVVAPNGVRSECFSEQSTKRGSKTVVFVAHLGWAPNVDAAKWFVHEVWPRVQSKKHGGCTLWLVGRSPAPDVLGLEKSDVKVFADVPSVQPFLLESDVAIAPLLAAGGTRIKILEALAAGRPVVATRLGALGLEYLKDSGFLHIEDNPERFAEAIVAFMDKQPHPKDVSSVVQMYQWRETLSPLVRLVSELLKDHVTGAIMQYYQEG